MKTIKSQYEIQAEKFIEKTGVKLEVKFLKFGKHFDSDTEKRDIYHITMLRGEKDFSFNFGQSIANSHYYVDYHLKGRKYDCNGYSIGEEKGSNYCNIGKCDFVTKVNGKKPTACDILACLTKYDPETFEDFCSNYGYDTDSRSAEKIYNAVKTEWQNVKNMFSGKEIEELQEIQ